MNQPELTINYLSEKLCSTCSYCFLGNRCASPARSRSRISKKDAKKYRKIHKEKTCEFWKRGQLENNLLFVIRSYKEAIFADIMLPKTYKSKNYKESHKSEGIFSFINDKNPIGYLHIVGRDKSSMIVLRFECMRDLRFALLCMYGNEQPPFESLEQFKETLYLWDVDFEVPPHAIYRVKDFYNIDRSPLEHNAKIYWSLND